MKNMKHNRIFLSLAHMSGEEQKFIQQAFDTNWVVPLGPNVNAFEASLTEYLGEDKQVVALNSGTAAIHLALIQLGVGPGDLVICQSFTFAASANPVRYLGATPVFVDSEPDTWNMDPRFLEEAIIACLRGELETGRQRDLETKRRTDIDSEKRGDCGLTWEKATITGKEMETEYRLPNTEYRLPITVYPGSHSSTGITGRKPKAIIPVHLYGMPAKMEEILAIAAKYEIPVLEDAAEALGSSYKGRKCGTFGSFACLSFNGNKIITTSGGGALVCPTHETAEKTRFYATQARDKAVHYQHSELGYNYRMSNICAGIGRGQMTVLDTHVASRRAIHDFYREHLSGFPGISLFENPSPEFASNHWLTCIQIDPDLAGFSREDLRLAMEEANIETRPLWKPMHLQPLYADAPYFGNNIAEALFVKGLCLPSSPVLTTDDLLRVTSVFHHLRKKK